MNAKHNDKTYTRITVAEAVLKTKNWRHFIKKVLKVKHGKGLAKGVFISNADIASLGQLCQSDPQIQGVRAYFTLEHNHEEWPYENLVKFIMVPVLESPDHPHGRDAPFLQPGVGEADNLDDSNVYDFTRPCPDCCDQTSILFENQEK